MKKLSLIFLAGSIAMVSCKKEMTTNVKSVATDSLNSFSNVTNATSLSTNFGVLPNGLTSDDKITLAQKLQVQYVRDQITLTDFTGKSFQTDKWLSNGFKILLNLNYQSGGIVPFPTDMVQYKQLLNNVLDVYTPEIAIIENEPFNVNYYSGPIENYFTELKAAINVCHSRGVKVADGGLNSQRVCELVYQNYVSKGEQQKADDFAARALIDKNLRVAQGKGSAEATSLLDDTRKMVDEYKILNLDYVNIHWYEPIKSDIDQTVTSPGVLQEVANYLRPATGHPVITNEFGQFNTTTTLIGSQVDAFRAAHFKYAVDFSNNSGGGMGSVALSNGIILKPNGNEYKQKVAQ